MNFDSSSVLTVYKIYLTLLLTAAMLGLCLCKGKVCLFIET